MTKDELAEAVGKWTQNEITDTDMIAQIVDFLLEAQPPADDATLEKPRACFACGRDAREAKGLVMAAWCESCLEAGDMPKPPQQGRRLKAGYMNYYGAIYKLKSLAAKPKPPFAYGLVFVGNHDWPEVEECYEPDGGSIKNAVWQKPLGCKCHLFIDCTCPLHGVAPAESGQEGYERREHLRNLDILPCEEVEDKPQADAPSGDMPEQNERDLAHQVHAAYCDCGGYGAGDRLIANWVVKREAEGADHE